MLSRPHPCLGWLYVNPGDTRRLFDRLCSFRDAELKKDLTFSGMLKSFIDWTWQTWLHGHHQTGSGRPLGGLLGHTLWGGGGGELTNRHYTQFASSLAVKSQRASL